MRPTLRYKREKLFLKQFLQKQKHSLKRRCPGVWDRLEKVSSVSAAILAIDDFTSQSCTSQMSRSLPPATKGELCFSSETSIRWLSRVTAESRTATSHSNHSRLIAPSQPQEPLRNRRPTCFRPGPQNLSTAAEPQPNHSHITATLHPKQSRTTATSQPHHNRITAT